MQSSVPYTPRIGIVDMHLVPKQIRWSLLLSHYNNHHMNNFIHHSWTPTDPQRSPEKATGLLI